jgi:cytochrome c oxidase subunit II
VNAAMLDPAGPAAEVIANVGWLLILGGAAVFAAVMSLLAWSLRGRDGLVRPRLWIVGGGVLFPGVVVAALFAYTLPLAPAGRPLPPAGALVVSVTAHMWWWEVRYPGAGPGAPIVTANEIRIPVGRPVYVAVTSSDVIHSFWVPALAGKIDMVPGRLQHLVLAAGRPGVYRGQCAEFCGEQHALMALHVVAEAPPAFERWLEAQARPAAPPSAGRQARGRDVFLANRCDACHNVRGIGEPGQLGPDLTHVAGRMHLGAGTLANGPEALARWITHVQQVKPGVRMPSYERLDGEERAALADWLGSLR